MEKPIGDNSLINTILATKIAETPTKKVEEVETPEPIVEEAKVIEEKPTPEIDYTEYEEEPSPNLEAEDLVEPEENLELIEASPERKEKRRNITAKWSVKLYDKLQGLLAKFTYDRLNTPQDIVARRNQLFKKVYEGKISEKETEELKQVNEKYDAFIARRGSFHDSVHLSEDLIEDINELVEDLLEMSGKDINPIWILVGLLLIQPVINMVTAFSHKMQYNTKF